MLILKSKAFPSSYELQSGSCVRRPLLVKFTTLQLLEEDYVAILQNIIFEDIKSRGFTNFEATVTEFSRGLL